MKKLLFLGIALALIIKCSSMTSSKQVQVVIFYDGLVLRTVSSKANDLIRWSQYPIKNNLQKWIISEKDSIQLFQDFLSSIIIDSSSYIPVSKNKVVQDTCGTFSYYDDRNDIGCNTMLIYYHGDQSKSDTVFFDIQSAMRVRRNNFMGQGDSTKRIIIQKILNDLSKQNN